MPRFILPPQPEDLAPRMPAALQQQQQRQQQGQQQQGQQQQGGPRALQQRHAEEEAGWLKPLAQFMGAFASPDMLPSAIVGPVNAVSKLGNAIGDVVQGRAPNTDDAWQITPEQMRDNNPIRSYSWLWSDYHGNTAEVTPSDEAAISLGGAIGGMFAGGYVLKGLGALAQLSGVAQAARNSVVLNNAATGLATAGPGVRAGVNVVRNVGSGLTQATAGAVFIDPTTGNFSNLASDLTGLDVPGSVKPGDNYFQALGKSILVEGVALPLAFLGAGSLIKPIRQGLAKGDMGWIDDLARADLEPYDPHTPMRGADPVRVPDPPPPGARPAGAGAAEGLPQGQPRPQVINVDAIPVGPPPSVSGVAVAPRSASGAMPALMPADAMPGWAAPAGAQLDRGLRLEIRQVINEMEKLKAGGNDAQAGMLANKLSALRKQLWESESWSAQGTVSNAMPQWPVPAGGKVNSALRLKIRQLVEQINERRAMNDHASASLLMEEFSKLRKQLFATESQPFDSAIERSLQDQTQVQQVISQRERLQTMGLLERGEGGQLQLKLGEVGDPEVRTRIRELQTQRGQIIRAGNGEVLSKHPDVVALEQKYAEAMNAKRQELLQKARETGEDVTDELSELQRSADQQLQEERVRLISDTFGQEQREALQKIDQEIQDLMQSGKGEPWRPPERYSQPELDLPDGRPELDTFLAHLDEMSDKQLKQLHDRIFREEADQQRLVQVQASQQRVQQIQERIADIERRREIGRQAEAQTDEQALAAFDETSLSSEELYAKYPGLREWDAREQELTQQLLRDGYAQVDAKGVNARAPKTRLLLNKEGQKLREQLLREELGDYPGPVGPKRSAGKGLTETGARRLLTQAERELQEAQQELQRLQQAADTPEPLVGDQLQMLLPETTGQGAATAADEIQLPPARDLTPQYLAAGTPDEYRAQLQSFSRDQLRRLVMPSESPEVAALIKRRTGRRVWQAKKEDIIDALTTMHWYRYGSPRVSVAQPELPMRITGPDGAEIPAPMDVPGNWQRAIDAEGQDVPVPAGDFAPRGMPADVREQMKARILRRAIDNDEVQPPITPLPERPRTTLTQGDFLEELGREADGQMVMQFATGELPIYKAGGKSSEKLIEEMRLRFEYQVLDAKMQQGVREAYMAEQGWWRLPWEEKKRLMQRGVLGDEFFTPLFNPELEVTGPRTPAPYGSEVLPIRPAPPHPPGWSDEAAGIADDTPPAAIDETLPVAEVPPAAIEEAAPVAEAPAAPATRQTKRQLKEAQKREEELAARRQALEEKKAELLRQQAAAQPAPEEPQLRLTFDEKGDSVITDAPVTNKPSATVFNEAVRDGNDTLVVADGFPDGIRLDTNLDPARAAARMGEYNKGSGRWGINEETWRRIFGQLGGVPDWYALAGGKDNWNKAMQGLEVPELDAQMMRLKALGESAPGANSAETAAARLTRTHDALGTRAEELRQQRSDIFDQHQGGGC